MTQVQQVIQQPSSQAIPQVQKIVSTEPLKPLQPVEQIQEIQQVVPQVQQVRQTSPPNNVRHPPQAVQDNLSKSQVSSTQQRLNSFSNVLGKRQG